jgi:S-adenosylmethionine hydrolase
VLGVPEARLISLTTDFGLSDSYVGAMRGVISSIAPGVPMVDITHQIAPQDVRSAAFVLWAALPYFPAGSVHLVVVDPGVGTGRRALASETSWGVLVGPDNGVFSHVWGASPARTTVELSNPTYWRSTVSSTFHGRDIFAPVAAHVAAGVDLASLGSPLSAPVRLPTPHLSATESKLRGEVLHIDHFGNAITSIGRLVWDGALLYLDPAFGTIQPRVVNPARLTARVLERDVGPIRQTYGDVAPGELCALVGSEGLLEIAINQGGGAAALGIKVGDPVEVEVV